MLGDTGGPLRRSHQPLYVLTEFIHGKRVFTRLNGLKGEHLQNISSFRCKKSHLNASRCHCVSSTGALLSVPVRDSCIYLLCLNVPDPSCQGQLFGRIMVGMKTLQTRTRPEQDGPNAPCQSSLPCTFSWSAVSHTAEAFKGPAAAESFVKQKTASWKMGWITHLAVHTMSPGWLWKCWSSF